MVGTGIVRKTAVYKPDKGHCVWGPDGKPYELDYVESDTVLYLAAAYGAGATAAGQSYSIDITRTATIPALSGRSPPSSPTPRGSMMLWQQISTGSGTVTLTAPDGQQVQIPSMTSMQQSSDCCGRLGGAGAGGRQTAVFQWAERGRGGDVHGTGSYPAGWCDRCRCARPLKVPGLYIGNVANMDFDTPRSPAYTDWDRPRYTGHQPLLTGDTASLR